MPIARAEALTAPPRSYGTAFVKRRPARGVVTDRGRFGRAFGQSFSEEVYDSPLYPHGLSAGEIGTIATDHQAAVTLFWFSINFEPLPIEEQVRFSDGTLAFFSDGVPVMMTIPSTEITADSGAVTADSEAPVGGRKLVDDFGSRLVDDFGRTLVEDVATEVRPHAELVAEFGEFISGEILGELAGGLLAQSKLWRFIPPLDPLPIELDQVPRLQSEVDAAIVARDAEAIEDHLKVAPTMPASRGQNYWPGAELVDQLRSLNETAREMKALAEAPSMTNSAPVEEAVGRLTQARNKISLWFAEGYVRGLGGAAANATVAGAFGLAVWWHTLFHLATTLLHSASGWMASLLRG